MKIGVVGGGQLGRMLAMAGLPLAQKFTFLDPSKDACAGQVGDLVLANYDDQAGIEQLKQACDLVTFEFESVPPSTVEQIGKTLPVFPSASALEVARDRLFEKSMFQRLGIKTAPFADINSQQVLQDSVDAIGLPCIAKTRTLGYDGKGQKVLKTQQDVDGCFDELGAVPLLLEGFVPFDDELSCVAVRAQDGSCAFYPLIENEHRQGILHLSKVTINHNLQALAEEYAEKVLAELDYVGVMTFEFFRKGEELLANEVAPRVHNSGHWSIEGANCSQFENHIRAVAGLPLGDTNTIGFVAMLNIIGKKMDEKSVLKLAGAHLHMYDKSEKPGRKIGHLTLQAETQEELDQLLAKAEKLLSNDLG